MVKFISTNLVGTASKKTWSQTQTITYSENFQVMTVIQLTCEDEGSLVDLATIGVGILTEIEHKGQSIESNNQLKKLVNEIEKDVADGLSIELLIAILRGTNLSIYGKGKVDAYLSRNHQLAKLNTDWDKGNVTWGILKKNDVVVLTTKAFVEIVDLKKFRDILTNEIGPAELLAPLLHMQSETSEVAAIVGEIKDEIGINQRIKLRIENPRRINLLIGGIIFVLLILMIGIGMVRRVKQISEKDFTIVNSKVNSSITETFQIAEINPERARVLLSEAKNEVTAYLATNITDEYKQKGKKLIETIDNADEQIFKKNSIQLTTIVELSILVDGMKTENIKSDGKGNLVFLDAANFKIVLMNLVDRSRQMIDISKNDPLVDIGLSETGVYGLSLNGLTNFVWENGKSKKVIEPDEFWKDPKYVSMFAGNAYILDKEQDEIWKYPTLGDTFGSRRRWFAAGINPDLSNVVDMKVVGDIWILTSTGKLERYSRGAPVAFSMDGFPAKGEPKKLSEPTALWVNDSTVYVLENGASRIVVFGTDGKYKAQYVNSEFVKATDLVIVDDKGYVLIDNMVKEFGL